MLDPAVKLRHLATFLEVARREGFARAAVELHVSQPAVSKTIRELEDLLGLTLIERGAGPFRLTGFGRTFLRHATISVGPCRRASRRRAGPALPRSPWWRSGRCPPSRPGSCRPPSRPSAASASRPGSAW